MKEIKYKYVICGAGGYYTIGYHDIMNLENVSYHSSYYSGIQNSFLKKLVRLTFSKQVNKIFKNPFSQIVYPRIYSHNFSQDEPICFLLFGHLKYVINSSYLDYLRRTYPSCKLVLYMQDLVIRFPEIDIEECKKKFDLVLSYDKGDCEKYNLLFHPTPMSYVEIKTNGSIPNSDVYFLGLAKGRYEEICKVFKKCQDLGLICDFHVLHIPKDAEKIDGIKYDENYMSYEENLMRVQKCKCILEVMQPNADGFTPRLWESIMYDRHLISNNMAIPKSKYYDAQNIITIEDFLAGTKELNLWVNGPTKADSTIKSLLSPRHLIDFIDSKLM